MSEVSVAKEATVQTRPQEAVGQKPAKEKDGLPKDIPVVNVKDIMMYAENMDGMEKMESKKLIPYVVYLDEQFKEIVQKKKKDARVILILWIVIMSVLAGALVFVGVKCFEYLTGRG